MLGSRYGNIGFQVDELEDGTPIVDIMQYKDNVDENGKVLSELSISEVEQLSSELFQIVEWFG